MKNNEFTKFEVLGEKKDDAVTTDSVLDCLPPEIEEESGDDMKPLYEFTKARIDFLISRISQCIRDPSKKLEGFSVEEFEFYLSMFLMNEANANQVKLLIKSSLTRFSVSLEQFIRAIKTHSGRLFESFSRFFVNSSTKGKKRLRIELLLPGFDQTGDWVLAVSELLRKDQITNDEVSRVISTNLGFNNTSSSLSSQITSIQKYLKQYIQFLKVVQTIDKCRRLDNLKKTLSKVLNLMPIESVFTIALNKETLKQKKNKNLFFFPYLVDYLNLIKADNDLYRMMKLTETIRRAADYSGKLDSIISYKLLNKFGENNEIHQSTEQLTDINTLIKQQQSGFVRVASDFMINVGLIHSDVLPSAKTQTVFSQPLVDQLSPLINSSAMLDRLIKDQNRKLALTYLVTRLSNSIGRLLSFYWENGLQMLKDLVLSTQ